MPFLYFDVIHNDFLPGVWRGQEADGLARNRVILRRCLSQATQEHCHEITRGVRQNEPCGDTITGEVFGLRVFDHTLLTGARRWNIEHFTGDAK